MPSGMATTSSPRKPGIGGNRQRHDAADDLDRARQHRRIGGAEHLQQQIKNDNGNDAGNERRHGSIIVMSAAKSMAVGQALADHFIWLSSAAAPLLRDSLSASRPPAA